MTTIDSTLSIPTSPVDLAIAMAAQHEDLARQASLEDERKAHLSTMRQIDKAASEMTKGNLPVKVGAVWLVNSRHDGGAAYRIDPARQTCTCEAGMHGKACWHVAAVQVMEQIGIACTDVDEQQSVQDAEEQASFVAFRREMADGISYSCASSGYDNDLPF